METEKTRSVIAMTLFLLVIVSIIYAIFSNPYGQLQALLLPMFILAQTYMPLMGDFLWFLPRGRQINLRSGVSATLRGQITRHRGGKATAIISIGRDVCPEKIMKEKRVGGGMNQFVDWLTGCVTIRLTGEDWQWQAVKETKCDNPWGAIEFVGGLDGKPIYEPGEGPLIHALSRQASINRYTNESLAEIESQLANISSQKLLDLDSASQLLEQIGHRVKNVRIMARRGGGSEDMVASEMASP